MNHSHHQQINKNLPLAAGKPPRAEATSSKVASLASSQVPTGNNNSKWLPVRDQEVEEIQNHRRANDDDEDENDDVRDSSLTATVTASHDGSNIGEDDDENDGATAELGLYEQARHTIFRSFELQSDDDEEVDNSENEVENLRVLKRANPVYDSDDEEDVDEYSHYSSGSASKRAKHSSSGSNVLAWGENLSAQEDGSFSLMGLWRPTEMKV